MREDEIKKIANEVVKILGEKGLNSSELNTNKPFKGVTMGSGGKIFQKPLVNNPSSFSAQNDFSDNSSLGRFTSQQIKNLGVARVSMCDSGDRNCQIAEMIDHTLLKANATQEEIGKICEEAKKYHFASVCVNPAYVSLSSQLLKGSRVMVATVIGFPLGSTTPTVKAIEARDAMANGADEIDMVINIGALKSGNDKLVFDDIRAVREATIGKTLKVIIEASALNDKEKVRACEMAKRAKADFVKTSTGFGSGGATVEDIVLMRATVGSEMGIKASGGIKNAEVAESLIKAGATRLGTSASIAIVSGGIAKKGQY